MKSIIEFLDNSCELFENKIAVIEEEKRITYKELQDKTKSIATRIIKENNNEPIAVFMEKGINAVCTMLGTARTGNAYSILNPDFPTERLEKIINTLESKIIITDEQHYDRALNVFTNKTVLKIEDITNTSINNDELNKIKERMIDTKPLYINFTSGSTGIPKGVAVSHQTLISFINIFTNKFNITENDIIGNQAPFDFDVSVKDIYSTIAVGATLVIIPKRMFSNPTMLLDYICESKVTTLIWAVSALCLITTFHGLDYKVPKDVDKILFSGEVMPLKHIKQWTQKLPNAKFVNLYGPTEITCNCTYHVVDKSLNYEKQIPIGQPFENEDVFLLDKEDKLITDEEQKGEICVKGSTLALGYYNNREATNKSFIQNPLNDKYNEPIYRTGDLGYYDKNGELCFAGRKDFQIKHLGHRIELEEIERNIEKNDNISRACCIYSEEKNKIYAFYIGTIDSKELKEFLKEKLPIYMIPNVTKQIEEFPLTKNGKIDRRELMKSYNIM